MKLVTVIAASTAEPMQDGLFSLLGGGLEGYVIPAVPAVTSLALVVQLSFQPEECNTPHSLRTALNDPSGNKIFEGAPFEISPDIDPFFPERPVSAFPIVKFPLITFSSFGIYTFKFLNGSTELGRLEFGISRKVVDAVKEQ